MRFQSCRVSMNWKTTRIIDWLNPIISIIYPSLLLVEPLLHLEILICSLFKIFANLSWKVCFVVVVAFAFLNHLLQYYPNFTKFIIFLKCWKLCEKFEFVLRACHPCLNVFRNYFEILLLNVPINRFKWSKIIIEIRINNTIISLSDLSRS